MSWRVTGLGAAGSWRWLWAGLIGCSALACTEPNTNDGVATGVVGDDPAADAGHSGNSPGSKDKGSEQDAGTSSSVSPTATPTIDITGAPVMSSPVASNPVASGPAASNPAASTPVAPLPSASSLEPVLDAGGPPNLDPPSQPQPPLDGGSPGTDPTDTDPPLTDDSTDDTDNEWGLDHMDDPIKNPEECPAADPVLGDACSEGLVCKYGAEPDCRSRWVCSGDTWWMEYAKRDCSDSCPTDEPTEGAPCEGQSMQCLYGDDPTCRSNWMCYDQQWWLIDAAQECNPGACPEEPPLNGLNCNPEVDSQSCSYAFAEGCSCSCWWEGDVPRVQWYCGVTQAGYPPEYLTACPEEQPIEGTFCDSGSTCGYVTLEECEAPGAGTTLANCVENKWVLTLPVAAE